MTDTEMRLEAGSVVALRFYDLGGVVDLDALASAAGGQAERPRFPTGAKGGLRYGNSPVELPLEDVEVPLEDGRVFADASLRVFDFGIAAIALRVLVGGMDWERFTERVEEIGRAVSGEGRPWEEAEQRARAAVQRARTGFKDDVIARHVIVIARRFAKPVSLDELVDDDYAASIVSRDWLPLASIARADLLRGARTSGHDLIVAGDERTFIVEPEAGSGVPDAVEAALAQRACFERAGTGASARGQADRLTRCAGLVTSERAGRLATIYATARDRFRVAEAEAAALRGAGAAGQALPWGRIAAVAAITSLIVSVLVGALT